MLNRFIDGYCRLITVLIVAALAVMVVLVFGNVVLRYGFNSGITVSEELSRWLFVWVTFLGAVVALNERTHLGSDMLVSRLSVTGKKVCLFLTHVLMLFICWLLFKGSLDQVMVNLESSSAAMEVPMSIFYASGMVCAVSSAVILVAHLLRLMRGELREEELIGIRESEDEPLDLSKSQH